MKDDQEFNVMFVLVVEKYEVLYNCKLEKYLNRNVKELAWQKVAVEVKCTIEECKKRWRMLRISLLRHIRENKKSSGSSGKKKKPFYLEDAMKYLVPYTKSRPQTGTVDSDEDDICENYSQMENSETISNDKESVNSSDIPHKNKEYRNEESQEVNKMRTSDLLESHTLPFVSTDLPKETPQMRSSKKQKTQISENWENSAVQCLTALSNKYNTNTKKKESSDEEDGNLLFLRSLLPDLKKLSDAPKRRFKRRIFTFYGDILNEDSVRSSIHSSLQSPYSSGVLGSLYDNNLQYCTENGKEYADLVNSAVFQ